jgi:hypothetical protein
MKGRSIIAREAVTTVTIDRDVHMARVADGYRWLAGKRSREEVDAAEAIARSGIELGAVAFPIALADFERTLLPSFSDAVRSAVTKRLVKANVIRLSMKGKGVRALGGNVREADGHSPS